MEVEQNHADRLLTLISKYQLPSQPIPERPKTIYKDSGQFLLPRSKNVQTQYSNLYFVRYHLLKDRFNWIHKKFIDSIQKINNQQEELYAIGTIYKEMKLKPTYFNQITGITNYTSEDDSLYLEDPSGRIKFRLNENCQWIHKSLQQKLITKTDLLTGMVVVVQCKVEATNLINVTKIYLPDFVEQTPFIIDPQVKGPYIALMSGINYDHQKTNLSKVIHFLKGNLFDGQLQQIASQIGSIFLVGNIIAKPEQMESLTGALMRNDDLKQMYTDIEKNWVGVDNFVNNLQRITPVNIMPGPHDPSSSLMPKQGFYKSYFQQTFKNDNNVQLLTNPTQGSWGQLNILGTSGENVKDLQLYSNSSQLELVENMIYWGHIAPSAPDSMGCYPFIDEDPFVIKKMPHLLFVGNCERYESKLIKNENSMIRIVCLPEFSVKQEMCLIDCNSLESLVINFDD